MNVRLLSVLAPRHEGGRYWQEAMADFLLIDHGAKLIDEPPVFFGAPSHLSNLRKVARSLADELRRRKSLHFRAGG